MITSYALLILVFPLGGLMARMPIPESLLDFGSMSDLRRLLIPAAEGFRNTFLERPCTGATFATRESSESLSVLCTILIFFTRLHMSLSDCTPTTFSLSNIVVRVFPSESEI